MASGQVRRGEPWPQPAASFDMAELSGRYVELCSAGPAAVLTAAVGLVRDAQCRREPAAWVTAPDAAFFPPDVAGHGVDLGALAVVRVRDLSAMLNAADRLLRSGGFGLAVADLRPFAARGGAEVPLSAQVRLAGLAHRHGAVLLCLLDRARHVAGAGSLASLRAFASRRVIRTGCYRCILRVTKDKRRGREWDCERVLRGPMGLR